MSVERDDPRQLPENMSLAPRSAVRGLTPYGEAEVEGEFEAPAGPVLPARPFSPRALLEYKWSILALFVPLAVLGVAIVAAVMVPEYSATAKIEVSPIIRQLVSSKSDMVPMYDQFRTSQVDHVKGPQVVDAALDDPNLRQTHWYRDEPATVFEQVLERLRLRDHKPARDRLLGETGILVEAPKNKQFIYVTMKTPWPGEAKLVVDTLTRAYAEDTDKRDSTQELDRMEKLRDQIRLLDGDLNLKVQQSKDYRERLKVAQPDHVLEEQKIALDKMIGQVRDLEMEIEIANQLQGLRAPATPASQSATATASSQPTPASAPTNALSAATQPAGLTPEVEFDDAEWRRLSDELIAARISLEDAQHQFGAKHPVVEKLQKTIDSLSARLQRRQARLEATGVKPHAADGSDIRTLTVKLEVLKRARDEADQDFKARFRDAQALKDLDVQIVELEKKRAEMKAELEKIEMNREVAGQVRRFPAYEPAEPDPGKRTKLMVAAAFGALAVSIGIALLRIRLSPTVNEPAEAMRPISGAFLGHLPLAPRGEVLDWERSRVVAEAVRIVRTALLNRIGTGGQVIQVTSAGPGTGKSTLCLLLARSLAQSGKRVLLLDADIRRPTLATRLQHQPSPGLLDVLAQRGTSWQAGLRTTTTPGLVFLPAGGPAHDLDVELLANGHFSGLLEQMRAAYDITIVDGAPLLGMADGAILARHADGTVMVVRERYCRRAALVESLAVLGAAGGRLLGTVFVGAIRHDTYGYGYGYGYSYPYYSASEDPTENGAAADGRDTES